MCAVLQGVMKSLVQVSELGSELRFEVSSVCGCCCNLLPKQGIGDMRSKVGGERVILLAQQKRLWAQGADILQAIVCSPRQSYVDGALPN